MQLIQKTDSELIALLKAGDFIGWEYLYQKYAALMYGTIMPTVNFQKGVADQILIKCFLELKKTAFFTKMLPPSLAIYLLQHCHRVIKTDFTSTGFKSGPHVEDSYSLLKAVIHDKKSIQEIAGSLGLTESRAKLRLRAEIMNNRKPGIAGLD